MVLELVELMKESTPSEAEKQGRSSGSLAWRLSRGETKVREFQPYTWKLEEDADNMKFVLSYSSAKDEYQVQGKRILKNWVSGLYQMNSIIRKEEKDWKMTYLARAGSYFGF